MALMMVCLEGLKGNKHLFCFCPLPLCRLRKKHLWPLLSSCIQFKTVFIMVSTTFCFAFQFPPFSVPSIGFSSIRPLSYYPRSLYYWRVIIFYFSIVVAKFQQEERSATHQEVSPISSLTKFLGQNIWDRTMEYPKVPPYIHTAKETQRKCCCAIRAASLLLDI